MAFGYACCRPIKKHYSAVSATGNRPNSMDAKTAVPDWARRIAVSARTAKMAARRFIDRKDGNVSIIFAASMLPVVMVGGMAVDYSRANSADLRLQASADAAADEVTSALPELEPRTAGVVRLSE